MTQKERIQRIVKDLCYPCCVGGSGVMVMNGMNRTMGDLDVFMATRDWFRFYEDVYRGPRRDPAVEWSLLTTGPGDGKRRQDPPYLEATLYELKVNIFFAWRVRDIGNIDPNKVWQDSVIIDGVRCQTLRSLLEWKLETRRKKDLPDILDIIEHYPVFMIRD